MSPDGPKIVSPEEKLLRLVRGKEPQALEPGSTPGVASAESAGRTKRPGGRWQLPPWWLTAVNISLGCLGLGVLISFVALLASPAPSVTVQLPPPPSVSEPPPAPPAEPVPSLAGVVSQPLFHVGTSPSGAPGRTGAPSTDAKAMAARLSLIGIVAGEPAQAIIEDAETKKTFFVSVGQGLIEGLMVEEIGENRVVLDLNGEKIELSL